VPEQVLIIACGALAREINALGRSYGWHHLHLKCVDARLHNRPTLIPDRLREIVEQEASRFESEFSDELLLQLIRNHGCARES